MKRVVADKHEFEWDMNQNEWHILDFSEYQDIETRKKVKNLACYSISRGLKILAEIKVEDTEPVVTGIWEFQNRDETF